MRWQALFIGVLIFFCGWITPTLAQPPCSIQGVDIVAANPDDASDICEGASRALWFLDEHGLALLEPVHVVVDDALMRKQSGSAAGVYLRESRQVQMLSYAGFLQFETWFNTPINRETYISLAAHEITHAITDSHFKINKPNVHAREYLAYVTLFATMPSELRKRMLNAMPGSTPEDEARLSLMVYLMDPMFFGAQSYRHFMSLNHAAQVRFLEAVLAGKVFAH